MPIAKMHKQRRVRRGTWKTRFTDQRKIWRGTTETAAVPTLTSISPTTAVAGGANFTLTCTGAGFVSGISRIMVNGGYVPTTFVSATSLTTSFQLSKISSAQTVAINVSNGQLVSTTPRTLTITAPG